MVVYLNYLAWARGEGGERATLPPASLGGLAKYVAKNDAEPKDAEGNINLNLVELDITEVPEEPTREGRAMPAILPYFFILIGALGIFFVMSRVINPPMRDDAIYDAVTKVTQPPSMEPRVPPRLPDRRTQYAPSRGGAEATVRILRAGDQPRRESGRQPRTQRRDGQGPRIAPHGRPADRLASCHGNDGRQAVRQGRRGPAAEEIARGIVGGNPQGGAGAGILDEFAKVSPPIQAPPGVVFTQQPPPIGHQLIAFAEAPDDATHAHFEVVYQLKPVADANAYRVEVTVTIRTDVEGQPVATDTFLMPTIYTLEQLDGPAMDTIRDRVVKDMVGKTVIRPARLGAKPNGNDRHGSVAGRTQAHCGWGGHIRPRGTYLTAFLEFSRRFFTGL